MSNVSKIKRQPVYIELGGEQKQLKYTLNSFAEMEDRYGSVDEALKAMEKGSIKAVRFMLWVGLIHADDTITEKQVGALIELNDLNELSEKMNQTMNLDLPVKETKETIVANPNA